MEIKVINQQPEVEQVTNNKYMSSTRKGVGKAMAMKKKKVASTLAGIKKYNGVPGVGRGSANPIIRMGTQGTQNFGFKPKKPSNGKGVGY